MYSNIPGGYRVNLLELYHILKTSPLSSSIIDAIHQSYQCATNDILGGDSCADHALNCN